MTAATDREIVASRTFDAPRDLVFRMWTEPEHVRQWWGPKGFRNTILSMDVRPGGQWRFIMHGPDGTDYKNDIIYREIVRPERIAYTHVSGPVFDAVATFDEEGGKTRVTVRMTFATTELRNRVVEQFGAVEGLEQTLDRLGETVAQGDFVISRVFDAPRNLLFRVWTEREHLEQWWGPKGVTIVSCTNDLRPGGKMHYAMRAPDGTVMWARWVYREIEAPERLVFVNSFSDESGGLAPVPFDEEWPSEMLSVITFEDVSGRTRVTVRFSAWNATKNARCVFAAGHLSMEGGWTGTFEQLEEYLATAAVAP